MKRLLGLSCLFLLFSFITELDAQKISGLLVDKDDNSIDNEELEITIRVCKNQDSLFQIMDTVTTKDYGIFQTKDLKMYFDANPTKTSDTIRYEITYRYRTEDVTTGKLKWAGVRISNQSAHSNHASEADHAFVADEANGLRGLNFDFGDSGFVTAVKTNGQTSFNVLNYPSQGTYNTVIDQSGTASFSFDTWANLLDDQPNESEVFGVRKDINGRPALARVQFWGTEEEGPYNIAFDANGDPTVIRDIVTDAVDDFQGTGLGNFSFDANGDIIITLDELNNALLDASPGTKNVFIDEGGTPQFTDDRLAGLFDTWTEIDDNSLIGTQDDGNGNPLLTFFDPHITGGPNGESLLNSPVVINQTPSGTDFISFPLNGSYGAMSNSNICATGFFPYNSPLLPDLETNKSASFISKNTSLWQKSKDTGRVDFINNIKNLYPEIVREVDYSPYGIPGKKETVDMMALVPLLSKSIKEQSDIIEDQQKQINELTALVEKLISESNK